MADGRSIDRLRFHYEVERELADQLRGSTRHERTSGLYSSVYEQLFERVADHPQHSKMSSSRRQEQIDASIKVLHPWINKQSSILELGCGDGALSLALANKLNLAVALDVADLISENCKHTPGFKFLISDGIKIDLPDNSINAAYSNQLMEHLHVDDALDQLKEIYRVLAPGGAYICTTPSALSGPHDVSKYFGDQATGFHLKEYTYKELSHIMKDAGFDRIEALIAVKKPLRLSLPITLANAMESAASWLNPQTRRASLMHRLLGVQIVAFKPS